jgi:hypothetical protein
MIGRVVDDWTSAMYVAEPDKDTIIHDAPTDWIRLPKFDARLAIQTIRNIGMRNGDDGGEFSSAENSSCMSTVMHDSGPHA